MTRRSGAADDARLDEIWSRLSTLFVEKRDRFFDVLRDHQLNPPHGFALTMLANGPLRMRELADRMNCDASYVTAVVDRLEETGLARRVSSTVDRRVKDVALTTLGEKTASVMRKAMSAPPTNLRKLTEADRNALLAILMTIVPDASNDLNPFGPPRT